MDVCDYEDDGAVCLRRRITTVLGASSSVGRFERGCHPLQLQDTMYNSARLMLCLPVYRKA